MAEVYKTEKVVTYGKKSFRIVKIDKHIQAFDANSKAEKPKALWDSKKDKGHFFRWFREQRKKHD